MCGESHIPFIRHSKTIHLHTHLNESGLHLNKYATIAFAKIVSNYLLFSDNSRIEILANILQKSKKIM